MVRFISVNPTIEVELIRERKDLEFTLELIKWNSGTELVEYRVVGDSVVIPGETNREGVDIPVASIGEYLVTNENGDFAVTSDPTVVEGNFRGLPAHLFATYYVKER